MSRFPEKPTELWGLWADEQCWLPAIDEDGSPILAFKSREDAMTSASAQKRYYGIESIPFRIY